MITAKDARARCEARTSAWSLDDTLTWIDRLVTNAADQGYRALDLPRGVVPGNDYQLWLNGWSGNCHTKLENALRMAGYGIQKQDNLVRVAW